MLYSFVFTMFLSLSNYCLESTKSQVLYTKKWLPKIGIIYRICSINLDIFEEIYLYLFKFSKIDRTLFEEIK